MKDHSELSAIFNADEQRVNWHDETLWWIRQKRDKAVNTLPEWELLRENASQIKQHTLSNLSAYLEQFEAKALANGVKVHWAANAAEHNEIVLSILKGNGINRMVKSKSMLTEECHLNTFIKSKCHDKFNLNTCRPVFYLSRISVRLLRGYGIAIGIAI